jgi:hypothetical protein
MMIKKKLISFEKKGLKKKKERCGQNRIKKKWNYKYPFLLSSMAGR